MGIGSKAMPLSPVYDAMSGCLRPATFSVSDGRLTVKAVLWDNINEFLTPSPEAAFNSQPFLWFELCMSLDEVYVNGQTRGEVLWRTMICDQGPDEEWPPRKSLETPPSMTSSSCESQLSLISIIHTIQPNNGNG